MKISLESKKKILDFILDVNTDFLGYNDSLDDYASLKFLREIADIDEMPSSDDRYSTAAEDIYQHMVNNNDWEYSYLFTGILKVYDNDQTFTKLVETFLSPDYRVNEEEILFLASELNEFLLIDKLQLAIEDYSELGLPRFKIKESSEVIGLPLEIKKNDIIFFVKRYGDSIEKYNSYSKYFLLNEHQWDDYGCKTSFNLYYFDAQYRNDIGLVKIMHDSNEITLDIIGESFYTLNNNFCSLGQNEQFYINLVNLFPTNYLDILYAIGDCAFSTDKLDDFEKHSTFRSSLVRTDTAERTLRIIKHQINGYDLNNLFKFDYNFRPEYSKEPVKISFDFNQDDNILANRIYAVIGKNGAGKTQLLTSLPINISEEKKEYFEPKIPMFSKLITVSYSIFDRFKIPRKTTRFNYVYCGLKSPKGEFITDRGLLLRFHKNCEKIVKMERLEKWQSILQNFIDEDVLNQFIVPSKNHFLPKYKVEREIFNKVRNVLSSGQNILLYIITEITANIRFDSLILYDEPETHLHPNAISQLINTIYDLVHEFQSYCIIGTHSPLIIQELLSKNVYVLERNNNQPVIRRIGLESFGENLSVLTDEVFGNREIPKQYKKIIDEQVDRYNKSYEQIIESLQFDDRPLSLSVKLYIKSKFIRYDESNSID